MSYSLTLHAGGKPAFRQFLFAVAFSAPFMLHDVFADQHEENPLAHDHDADDSTCADIIADVAPPAWLSYGGIILVLLVVVIMFWALAVVCEDYFVPALHVFCESANFPDDVAGATFMAAGASSPEMFTSFLSLLVFHSNIGVGTVVGSEIFNHMIISAGSVLFAKNGVLQLDPAVIHRDIIAYMLSLLALIYCLKGTIFQSLPDSFDYASWDECLDVTLYGSMLLVGLYAVYAIVCAYYQDLVQHFIDHPLSVASFHVLLSRIVATVSAPPAARPTATRKTQRRRKLKRDKPKHGSGSASQTGKYEAMPSGRYQGCARDVELAAGESEFSQGHGHRKQTTYTALDDRIPTLDSALLDNEVYPYIEADEAEEPYQRESTSNRRNSSSSKRNRNRNRYRNLSQKQQGQATEEQTGDAEDVEHDDDDDDDNDDEEEEVSVYQFPSEDTEKGNEIVGGDESGSMLQEVVGYEPPLLAGSNRSLPELAAAAQVAAARGDPIPGGGAAAAAGGVRPTSSVHNTTLEGPGQDSSIVHLEAEHLGMMHHIAPIVMHDEYSIPTSISISDSRRSFDTISSKSPSKNPLAHAFAPQNVRVKAPTSGSGEALSASAAAPPGVSLRKQLSQQAQAQAQTHTKAALSGAAPTASASFRGDTPFLYRSKSGTFRRVALIARQLERIKKEQQQRQRTRVQHMLHNTAVLHHNTQALKELQAMDPEQAAKVALSAMAAASAAAVSIKEEQAQAHEHEHGHDHGYGRNHHTAAATTATTTGVTTSVGSTEDQSLSDEEEIPAEGSATFATSATAEARVSDHRRSAMQQLHKQKAERTGPPIVRSTQLRGFGGSGSGFVGKQGGPEPQRVAHRGVTIDSGSAAAPGAGGGTGTGSGTCTGDNVDDDNHDVTQIPQPSPALVRGHLTRSRGCLPKEIAAACKAAFTNTKAKLADTSYQLSPGLTHLPAEVAMTAVPVTKLLPRTVPEILGDADWTPQQRHINAVHMLKAELFDEPIPPGTPPWRGLRLIIPPTSAGAGARAVVSTGAGAADPGYSGKPAHTMKFTTIKTSLAPSQSLDWTGHLQHELLTGTALPTDLDIMKHSSTVLSCYLYIRTDIIGLDTLPPFHVWQLRHVRIDPYGISYVRYSDEDCVGAHVNVISLLHAKGIKSIDREALTFAIEFGPSDMLDGGDDDDDDGGGGGNSSSDNPFIGDIEQNDRESASGTKAAADGGTKGNSEGVKAQLREVEQVPPPLLFRACSKEVLEEAVKRIDATICGNKSTDIIRLHLWEEIMLGIDGTEHFAEDGTVATSAPTDCDVTDDAYNILSFPDSRDRVAFGWHLIVYPLKMCFYYTLVDCREERHQSKYLPVIAICVFYLALLSFVMITCCDLIGSYLGANATVMGLTLSAIGTSFPNLWSSLVVARQGYGNMAICNALGSNIFNINIALGLPWLVYILSRHGADYDEMRDNGIVFFVVVLEIVCVKWLLMIALNRFQMHAWMAWIYILIYLLVMVLVLVLS